MVEIFIKTEFIKLGQLIKYVNLISNGGDIKEFLTKNKVLVNNEFENRRGRKLYENDHINVCEQVYIIKRKED